MFVWYGLCWGWNACGMEAYMVEMMQNVAGEMQEMILYLS